MFFKYRRLLITSLLLIISLSNISKADVLTPKPIEDPQHSLKKFFHALSYTMTKYPSQYPNITRIIHYGDSHIAADVLTGDMRKRFQAEFGNGGNGFVLAAKPWNWYARNGVVQTSTSGWKVNGLATATIPQDNSLGLSGISFTAESRNETITMQAAGRYFDLYMLKQPQGGTLEISLDGKVLDEVSLNDANIDPDYYFIDAHTDSNHTISLCTLDNRPVRLYGLTVEHDNDGVCYDSLGINGARAMRINSWNWPLLVSNIARRNPDLIVLSYGSNEAGDDLDIAEYENNFKDLLDRFRTAAPYSSILVIAPPDRARFDGRRWQSMDTVPKIVEAQRSAAMRAGVAFWDLYHVMGGEGSIDRWARTPLPLAQKDRVHLTPDGYRLVSSAFYRELTEQYMQMLWQESWRNWWPLFRIGS